MKDESDDDDVFEEKDYDDEDDAADDSDEEEYIHGRSKLSKRGRGGGGSNKGTLPRGRGRSRGRTSRIVEEIPAHSNKRQKLEGMQGAENSGDLIELHGNLLLIYKRNNENRMQIDNLNIVLKGIWRLAEDKNDS